MRTPSSLHAFAAASTIALSSPLTAVMPEAPETLIVELAESEHDARPRPRVRVDAAVFEAEINPHLPKLKRLALVLAGSDAQAEDLLQNALVKAYLNYEAFEGRAAFVSWLYAIVRREHAEMVRTAARRRTLLARAVDACRDLWVGFVEDAGEQITPEETTQSREERSFLLDSLQMLPEAFRTVVVLLDVEDMSYAEVADMLAIPIGTVKSRHSRALERLRVAYDVRRTSRAFGEENT
jgi:RNA polymerase sigma-70 factor, ECF subfamily